MILSNRIATASFGKFCEDHNMYPTKQSVTAFILTPHQTKNRLFQLSFTLIIILASLIDIELVQILIRVFACLTSQESLL